MSGNSQALPLKKRPQRQNPIQAAVSKWLGLRSADAPHRCQSSHKSLEDDAPKRFTVYEPMALLPTGSFSGPLWVETIQQCDNDMRSALWSLILEELSKRGKTTLTHLAVNEGIPLDGQEDQGENILRSPNGLRMLYGDFGPAQTKTQPPTTADLDETLWVSTKQNGIHQVWAPQWTMFSRGNIKEKARVLEFGAPPTRSHNAAAQEHEGWAIDLYAGIGYFVFSYARLGVRVLCWEINPWSVEGLRRGAIANKWTVRIVQDSDLALPNSEILHGGQQIVVFLEDNQRALQRLRDLQTQGLCHLLEHINCGFLPTSQPVWHPAWQMSTCSPETWLHLHENVGVDDIESRRMSIQNMFDGWSSAEEGRQTANVAHVEKVKTFAPDVWHCVFDVHLTRCNNAT